MRPAPSIATWVTSVVVVVLLDSGPPALAQEPSQADAIVRRYLDLPYPQDDPLGESRSRRLEVLRELQRSPVEAVRAISRALPDTQDARQRAELAEALGECMTPEAAAKLCDLLADPDERVRGQAIHRLRLMARRVDRVGGRRDQRGNERAPRVGGLVPHLIRAARDAAEPNRVAALYALADTLDPAAIEELRNRLEDDGAAVRFHAACLLTEFRDASGLGEMKRALERLRGQGGEGMAPFETERLLASFERITGKSFGAIPSNPHLSSDSRAAARARERYGELLEAWAAWWAWEPGAGGMK